MRLIATSVLVSLCALGALPQEAQACDCFRPPTSLSWPAPGEVAAPNTQRIVVLADFDNDTSQIQITANGEPIAVSFVEPVETFLGFDCGPVYDVLHLETPLPPNAEVIVSLDGAAEGEAVFKSSFTTAEDNGPPLQVPDSARLFAYDVIEPIDECGIPTTEGLFFFEFERFSVSEPIFVEMLDSNATVVQRSTIRPPAITQHVLFVTPIDPSECVTLVIRDLDNEALLSEEFCQADKCASGTHLEQAEAQANSFWQGVSDTSCDPPVQGANGGCATAPGGPGGTGALFVLAALLFWRRRP